MFGVNHEDLSTDEPMVLFFGGQLCQNLIRAKLIQFAYKIWVLASSTEVQYYIDIYEGKTAATINKPLKTCVTTKKLQVCSQPEQYRVDFYIFFTSWRISKGNELLELWETTISWNAHWVMSKKWWKK